MAEGTYEYECMRAELLGLEKPNYDEFLKRQKENEAAEAEEDEIDTENLKEAEAQSDSFKHITGKLEDLNVLLSKTQKKIDTFKTRCGSITTLIKSKVGSFSQELTPSASNEDIHKQEDANKEENLEENNQSKEEATTCRSKQKKTDLTRALGNHVDVLDSMLEKAENAHYSMSQQNKQMKKFINK